MNAETQEDSTDYFYNFPANRVELWFYLESSRFLHPVSREFYKERYVVREERRMRVESRPAWQALRADAGHRDDRASLPRSCRAAGPATSKTCAPPTPRSSSRILRARQHHHRDRRRRGSRAVRRSCRRIFSAALPKRPLPAPVITVEPEQEGPSHVEVGIPSAAYGIRRLPPARSVRQRRSGLRRDLRHSLRRPHQHHLSGTSCATNGWLSTAGAEPLPRRQVSESVLLLSYPRLGHTAEENEKELDAVITTFQKDEGG